MSGLFVSSVVRCVLWIAWVEQGRLREGSLHPLHFFYFQKTSDFRMCKKAFFLYGVAYFSLKNGRKIEYVVYLCSEMPFQF